MAERPNDRKSALIAELDSARSRATAFRREVKGDLDVSGKAKANINRNRIGWMVGAGLTGLLVATMPRRTKKVVVDRRGKAQPALQNAGKTGMALAIVKLAVDVTKPVIMAWATKRLGQAVAVGKSVERKVDKVDEKT